MVRLMERAAVNALAPHLAPGQQSVGVLVNVKHLDATPLGATVIARAELIAVDGRRLTFRVSAHDGLDLIGEGIHERMLIDLARFEAKARAKAQAANLNLAP
jgi:fluoroacetyl-CoA thioesterase